MISRLFEVECCLYLIFLNTNNSIQERVDVGRTNKNTHTILFGCCALNQMNVFFAQSRASKAVKITARKKIIDCTAGRWNKNRAICKITNYIVGACYICKRSDTKCDICQILWYNFTNLNFFLMVLSTRLRRFLAKIGKLYPFLSIHWHISSSWNSFETTGFGKQSFGGVESTRSLSSLDCANYLNWISTEKFC